MAKTETKIIRARFIGRNSLGYKRGEIYTLKVNDRIIMGFENAEVVIERENGYGICPYQTMEAFNKNWEWLSMYKK